MRYKNLTVLIERFKMLLKYFSKNRNRGRVYIEIINYNNLVI